MLFSANTFLLQQQKDLGGDISEVPVKVSTPILKKIVEWMEHNK